MAKILIIRFSALGDVAMTVPVVYSLATAYPMHEITVLSRPAFSPLFQNMPPNVHFVGADMKKEYRGLKGLNRLFRKLKSESFDYVADFHSVLRTHFLRCRFRMEGVATARIDKGRREKKALIRRNNKKLTPLKTSFIRYKDVLSKLGFDFKLRFSSVLGENRGDFTQIIAETGEIKEQKWVGIAPFAKHKGKIYPLELQEQVLRHLAADPRLKVFLFGGGENEKKIIDSWVEKYPTMVSMVGKLSMDQEIVMMSCLDVMFSMDSANMHMASLVATPVVSLWGATHPYAGFMGWNQTDENAVQTNLSCRPCSVYGQKPCYRNDYACLWQLTPETVIQHIERVIF